MVRKESYHKRENMSGGSGIIHIYNILTKEETSPWGRMYAKVIIPPQSSIGWHVHEEEVEPYYILQGHGIFVDNDHIERTVENGDVCIINPGEGHGIINTSEEDLIIMALIYRTPSEC